MVWPGSRKGWVFGAGRASAGLSGRTASDPETQARTMAFAEHGARALALAGQALDPNYPGGPSLTLGQLLLKESFLAVARAVQGDSSLASLDAALEALRRPSEPEGSARSQRLAEAVATLAEPDPRDRAALARAELEIARLVDAALGQRRLTRAARRARWVIGLLIVAVTTAFAAKSLLLAKPWEKFLWTASSAWEGFPDHGSLGQRGSYGLLFHTQEQENPWVVVDLLTTREIEKVRLVNRADVDSARGLPLVLELAGEDRRFVALGTRRTQFDVLRMTFTRRPARYLRLRSEGTTVLHLSEIQIQ